MFVSGEAAGETDEDSVRETDGRQGPTPTGHDGETCRGW